MIATAAHQVTFWRPAPPLQPYVSGYHRYVVRPREGERIADAFYPAWANMRFTLASSGDWAIRIGRRVFDAVPAQAMFGPSSHAGYVDAPAGTMVGIGLTPLGWARLIGGDATKVADRVAPLSSLTSGGDAVVADLVSGTSPDRVFDAWLLARLATRPAENPAIARIFGLLNDPAIGEAGALAEAAGLAPRQVARLTRRHFGFTPKLLLRRARFVRALTAAMEHDRGRWAEIVRAAGYFDGSHFLRDCHAFLGCALGAFEAMPRPLNRASAAERMRMLGAPMQSMHQPETVPNR